MPRIAVALGVRAGAAARAPAGRIHDDGESARPRRRQRVEFARRGADRLPELRLLPVLAPGRVARVDALGGGGYAASLRYALASSPHDAHDARDESGEVAAGRIEIDFDRLQQADRRLAGLHHAPNGEPPRVTRWPWQRLVARGDARGDAIDLRVELTGRDS
jgi:hypothetical protein